LRFATFLFVVFLFAALRAGLRAGRFAALRFLVAMYNTSLPQELICTVTQ
jgi:hypothetical protein